MGLNALRVTFSDNATTAQTFLFPCGLCGLSRLFVPKKSRASRTDQPAHLHYSIATLVPYPWRIDDAPVGWQKMFYLNPIEYLDK